MSKKCSLISNYSRVHVKSVRPRPVALAVLVCAESFIKNGHVSVSDKSSANNGHVSVFGKSADNANARLTGTGRLQCEGAVLTL